MRVLARAMPFWLLAYLYATSASMPARTGQSSRSNQAGPWPKGARTVSKIALEMAFQVVTRSADVAEPLQALAHVLVVLGTLEVEHLLLEDVRDELFDRG